MNGKHLKIIGVLRCIITLVPLILRTLPGWVKQVILLVDKLYSVNVKQVCQNIVFCTRNMSLKNCRYDLSKTKALAEILFKSNFFIYYEPEIGAGIWMPTWEKPKVTLILYANAFVCAFLSHTEQIVFVENILAALYTKTNLKLLV